MEKAVRGGSKGTTIISQVFGRLLDGRHDVRLWAFWGVIWLAQASVDSTCFLFRSCGWEGLVNTFHSVCGICMLEVGGIAGWRVCQVGTRCDGSKTSEKTVEGMVWSESNRSGSRESVSSL